MKLGKDTPPGVNTDNMKTVLNEAYGLITKLEKENNMLLHRIDHLEEDNTKRLSDNNRLYTIIENKNKEHEELLRNRDLLANDFPGQQSLSHISKKNEQSFSHLSRSPLSKIY